MFLQINNLDFSYGDNRIFEGASLILDEHSKIGLIGSNGIGKSTLLELINDVYLPDGGTIEKDEALTIGYLHQNTDFHTHKTVNEIFNEIFADFIGMEDHVRDLEKQIESADVDKLDELLEEYGRFQDELNKSETRSYKSKIIGTLKGLGFKEEDLYRDFDSFSGGQKTSLLLAMELLKEPDLLLLDEPTNFLDIESLEWLENFLKNYNKSFLVISHDRYFLDAVCKEIVEVEDHKLKSYPGNYSNYLQKKETEREELLKRKKKIDREIEKEKQIIRRYRDINSKQSNRHARSREKRLEKLEKAPVVSNKRTSSFTFKSTDRSGDRVLTVEEVSKSYGDHKILDGLSFQVNRTEKIGLIGANGVGKSTLFHLLKDPSLRDTGSVTFGTKVKTEWFEQEFTDLLPLYDLDLISAVREFDTFLDDGQIRSILASFLFYDEDVDKKVSELSGGEKVRLKLIRIVLSEANFLVLDEPTNHLDLETKELLEEVLKSFDGTILIISHDRYLLNKIADQIFELTPAGMNSYLGNYNDYYRQKNAKEEIQALKEEKPSKTQRKLEQKKKRELEKEVTAKKRAVKTLEDEIEEKTLKIRNFEEKISEKGFYQSKDSMTILNDYNALKEEISALEEAWEVALIELEDFEEKLNSG